MVYFNELKINQEGTKLIIDVYVKAYIEVDVIKVPNKNVFIDTISVGTQDTYTENNFITSPIYTTHIDEDTQSVRLELDRSNLAVSLVDNMFFVKVTTRGVPPVSTPCNQSNPVAKGVAYYIYPLYQKAISYTDKIGKECSIPKSFINFILQIKAYQLAVNTGHYTKAVKYWETFFKNIGNEVITNKCSCYE